MIGATSEDSAATGVNGVQTDNSALDAGAAYIFTRIAGVWSQQAYLKASNTEAGDQFGHGVAIFGDTVVVGAPTENSAATGVNGVQADNSAPDAGTAYIFTRIAGVWSQQAYLKASNTEAGDEFGDGVAISGDTVVVGAQFEDSNATGVDGNQSDNSALDSGAVYVFDLGFSIGGSVIGLATGSHLTLQNNAGDDLALGSNGNFTFRTGLPDASSYAVTVKTQPTNPSQTCNITNDTGTLVGADITDVAVNCVTNTFTIGGGVSGLIGPAENVVLQLGSDIDGGLAGDQAGYSVAISADGSRVAIGALFADGENGTDSGRARVFDWNGSAWVQLGPDFDGSTTGDRYGSSVDLSANGDRLAVGAPWNNSSSGPSSGHVRVFDWTGATWVQAGADIDGESAGSFSGDSVALSADGRRLAIGAPQNNGNGTLAGQVRVYDWTGTSWVQAGGDLDGKAAQDRFGISVSLSADGNRVVSGGYNNSDAGELAGHARVFQWDSENWVQLGNDLGGEAAGDRFGYSVSISAEGERIAIGAFGNSGSTGEIAGHVRVFDWDGLAWVQAGSDIDGEAAGDNSGWSVSLSGDGARLAVGAIGNDGTGFDVGHVRVYSWSGLNWVQSGGDLDGDAADDEAYGWSVAMASDGTLLAIGGHLNDGSAEDAGRVQVFALGQSPLELQNKGSDDLSIAADGAFTFATALEDLSPYHVSVLRHPVGPSQTCMVSNGDSVLASVDVTDVAITCEIDTFYVGGAVTGLIGSGLVLQINAENDLPIGADGGFTFSPQLINTESFVITVLSQPISPSQTCTVIGGDSAVVGADISDVIVECITDNFTVGGDVSGLEGSGLVLQNNLGNDRAISANGSFTFTTPLTDGSGYAVTVSAQPADLSQTCSVTSGSGTLAGADVTNVSVNCVTDTFTVGGTVSGLAGSGLVLQNNAGDDLPVSANGGFTFSTALTDGSGYAVTVSAQPADLSQTCSVTSGSGTLAGANVTNVLVTCTANTYSIGGNVSGFEGSGLVLQNNAGDDLPVSANGSFTFTTPLTDGSDYAVTVKTQPTNPSQTCSVSNGSSTLAGSNVTNVAVTCTTNTYTIGGTVFGPGFSNATGQIQLSQDLDGEARDNRFGSSVSMSEDGHRLAVGAPRNSSSSGEYAGHVRVYDWVGMAWVRVGADIDGEAFKDYSGSSVSLSADGNRLAVGAPLNRTTNGVNTDAYAGHVRVFDWDGNSWEQIGADIDGKDNYGRFGTGVALSANGGRLAVRAPTGDNGGYVRVFAWDGVDWVRVGNDIDGSGDTVSLSADGSRLATGDSGTGWGHVRVFELVGYNWVQLGDDLDGEAAGDYFGAWGVSLSADGERVAVGAHGNDENGDNSGHVRVFDWIGSEWVQAGLDINGEAAGDLFGISASLSGDGNRLAVGALGNDENGDDSGHVRVFDWTGSEWVQAGSDLNGEAADDESGSAISLSANGYRLAVGAPTNDGNGQWSGHVRTYDVNLGLVLQNNGSDDLFIRGTGPFSFDTSQLDLSNYAVTVLAQPDTSPSQTCSVSNNIGSLGGANVTNVVVNCVVNTFNIAGTISGLSGSGLVLQNNSGDDLAISANGSFTFTTPLTDGTGYAVTVLTQPSSPSQTCSVTNGSGILTGADVTNVSVTCTNIYTIGGNVSGLEGAGLVLQNNLGNDRAISANGSFTFTTPLTDGTGYSVTVKTQPTNPSQTCTVSNGSGTLAGANVTNVSVTCTTNTYTIGGNVSGLAGSGLVLQNNLGNDRTVSANGSFTFTTPLTDGTGYAVTVQTQPTSPSQICTVSNGSSTLAGANVTNVSVTCTTNTYSIGGNVSGLQGSGLVLQNNAGDDLPVSANGSFTFTTPLTDGTGYAVTVKTQPTNPSQTCAVSNGSGALSGSNINNTLIACSIGPEVIFANGFEDQVP